METIKHVPQKLGLTTKIFMAMILGISLGSIMHYLPLPVSIDTYLTDGLLDVGGKVFISLIKMIVVPIVFVSLVSGTCSLGSGEKFGAVAIKTTALYMITTPLAVAIALLAATLFHVGEGSNLATATQYTAQAAPSIKAIFVDMIPTNPIAAIAGGNMLQIIVFSIFLGLAIAATGSAGDNVRKLFIATDTVIMKLMSMIMHFAPIGVFCLVCSLFARVGFGIIGHLLGYFLTVLVVLLVQLFGTYSLMLTVLGRLSPLTFFRKMIPGMMFAFSTSSSNASIPVMLDVVENRLGVKNDIASFVIPFGATVNMDGTAIMQGVATVFIANAYGIDIGISGYLTVILIATLACIGTAGVPSVGLITLTMVLQQVNLPIDGIALIIGVDRLLDMSRTVVNVTCDGVVACIVARSEGELNMAIFNGSPDPDDEETL